MAASRAGRRGSARLDDGAGLDVRATRRRRVPGRAPRQACGGSGGTYPAVFNAANEQAVAAFHAGRIGWLDIVDTIERVVDAHEPGEVTLDGVLEAERWARRIADALLH
ncbi:MAG TPA: hypothetical protein VK631_17880 [Solirubrobacteraceae bacterium]|nr:hypothetical protein [Solirubrobacteraceae bacterium]